MLQGPLKLNELENHLIAVEISCSCGGPWHYVFKWSGFGGGLGTTGVAHETDLRTRPHPSPPVQGLRSRRSLQPGGGLQKPAGVLLLLQCKPWTHVYNFTMTHSLSAIHFILLLL